MTEEGPYTPTYFYKDGSQPELAETWARHWELYWDGYRPDGTYGPTPRNLIVAHLADLDNLRITDLFDFDGDETTPAHDDTLFWDSYLQKWRTRGIPEVTGVGASNLSELGDVALSDPASGEALVFNGLRWANAALSLNFPQFYRPEDYGAVGDGITDDGDAIRAAYVAASVTGGIVILSKRYGFTGKIKHYGGMGAWQIASQKIPAVTLDGWSEPGLVALDSTAWYSYGDGADGSGSANDNPGSIWGLVVDGNNIAGAAHDAIFVCDAAQPSIYDLTCMNSIGAGFFTGRSQNMNIHNLQVSGNVIGILAEPNVLGQQGPGHMIFNGGHAHDNQTNLHVRARGATDFFGAHDIVFSETLFETGRVAGQPVNVNVRHEVGDLTLLNCNLTYGVQVGGGTGNNVVEDCAIILDNPVFTGYSTRLSIVGGSVGGGGNTVTDGIRIKQSGSANILNLSGGIAWANVANKICVDGSVLGGADAVISHRSTDTNVTGGINDVRLIGGATFLVPANKTWLGTKYELPSGTISGGGAFANGLLQNPIVISHKDEASARLNIDWNGTLRYLDPTTGATIGSLLRNGATLGFTGRFGLANGFFRSPAITVQAASGAWNIPWDTTSHPILGITASSVNITSVTFNPTVAGGVASDGQEIRVGISLSAGLTPGTITWPAGVLFEPNLGAPQPVAGLTQYVTLSWRTGVGWIEVSRSHIGSTGVPTTRQVIAGSGLSGGGVLSSDVTLDVNVDGSTLEISSDTVRVKDAGITGAKIASSVALAGSPTTTTQTAGDNSTKIATTAYADAAAAAVIAAADAMVFKGVIDCSANPNYPAADRGHTYRVSVAGKIGGATGTNVEAGDILLCLTDSTAAGTQATVGASWSVIQVNIDGAVTSVSGVSVAGRVVTFADTTGKVVQDSGVLLTDLVTLTGAQTLTNKRITKRVSATTSTATLTISCDSFDFAKVTGQNVPLTIANPTGTPTSAQPLEYRLKDDGTARAITWGSAFRAFGSALPVATTAGKTTYVGCRWNSDDAKWDVVAVNTEV
jgi:hypothetical protein